MIRKLYQPEGSNLCGQTCVAMIAGVTIDEACTAVGHRHSTNARALYRGMENLGIIYNPTKRINGVRSNCFVPSCCIARVHYKLGKRTHWVVIWDNDIYDPIKDNSAWRVTSYIEILK